MDSISIKHKEIFEKVVDLPVQVLGDLAEFIQSLIEHHTGNENWDLSDEQMQELIRRRESSRANPEKGSSWEDFMIEMKSNHGFRD